MAAAGDPGADGNGRRMETLMISQKTRKRGITIVLTLQTKQRRLLKVEGWVQEESGGD